MGTKKIQLDAWERLIEAGDPSTQDFHLGPSPGGAASELGISRQAVHAAIRRGDLEALAVFRGRNLSHYTISVSSLQRFKEQRRNALLAQLKRAL